MLTDLFSLPDPPCTQIDGVDVINATDSTFYHVFTEEGIYGVRVLVTNPAGAVLSNPAQVKVTTEAPASSKSSCLCLIEPRPASATVILHFFLFLSPPPPSLLLTNCFSLRAKVQAAVAHKRTSFLLWVLLRFLCS